MVGVVVVNLPVLHQGQRFEAEGLEQVSTAAASMLPTPPLAESELTQNFLQASTTGRPVLTSRQSGPCTINPSNSNVVA